MAVVSERITFRHRPTNWNYPGHRDRVPRLYVADESLRVLHYHDRLDRFGLIEADSSDCVAVEHAVDRVNRALAARSGQSLFHDLHRRNMALATISAVPALPVSMFSD